LRDDTKPMHSSINFRLGWDLALEIYPLFSLT
jgi:hypothetical protein